MLISKCNNRDEILSAVSKELKEFGFKFRNEKQKAIDNNKRRSKKFFKISIQNQQTENAELNNGIIAPIPKFVIMACERIQSESKTEGIFRKTGSKVKQTDIKQQIENGGSLTDKIHNVIDIANLLKTYFRELPEPLIPPGMIQDSLIRCLIHCSSYEKKVDAILMTTLFLSPITINTLAYFLQFLEAIGKNSSENFMTVENLVKVITPTIMPLSPNAPEKRLQSHFKIMELLIENANLIGIIPDRFIKQLEIVCPPMTEERKKKKRRSGSINRVFNGFRKIVGALGSSSENLDNSHDIINTTTIDEFSIMTPNLTKSSKKRRLEKFDATSVFSSKKKKDGLTSLSVLPEIDDISSPYAIKSRKSFDNKPSSNESPPRLRRHSLAPGNTLRMRKRITPDIDMMKIDEEYVKVSKSEYEAFKTRLSSIETKISHEFNAAKLDAIKAEMQTDTTIMNGPEKVENKFHETLQEVEKFEDTCKTEQLAKRLSRELKIRPHIENPIIRSPSARKIGSLRRRRDSATRLSRNQSWHLGPSSLSSMKPNDQEESGTFVSSFNIMPKPNLKRAKLVDSNNGPYMVSKESASEKVIPEKPVRKTIQIVNTVITENWTSATDFFNDPRNEPQPQVEDQSMQQDELIFKTPNRPKKMNIHNDIDLNHTPMLPPRMTPAKRNTPMSEKKTPMINRTVLLTPSSALSEREARASIIQLRNQNAGMVAQKAKLFDDLSTSDATAARKSTDAPIKIPRVVINKQIENVKKMTVEKNIPQKSNVPLNSPRRSSRSPGVNRRFHLRAAAQSPVLKTIRENRENIDRRIDLLKSDILNEIASPRKRQNESGKKVLTQNNTPRRGSKTPTSSKKHRMHRNTPSKSPRVSRRHNISFD